MESVDVGSALDSLLAIAVVAALAPLLLGLVPRLRIPQVVLLLAGGIVIGPQVLGLATPQSVEALADLGLGFVFLLAGYEIDQRLYREDTGRRAVVAWFVALALALGVTGILAATGYVHAFVAVALALTTTALGTLVPILREGCCGAVSAGTCWRRVRWVSCCRSSRSRCSWVSRAGSWRCCRWRRYWCWRCC